MFDPTGGRTSILAIFIIVALLVLSMSLVFCSVLAIINRRNRLKHATLSGVALLWLCLVTAAFTYHGQMAFGLFIAVMTYSPIHIVLWCVFSLADYLRERFTQKDGSGPMSHQT